MPTTAIRQEQAQAEILSLWEGVIRWQARNFTDADPIALVVSYALAANYFREHPELLDDQGKGENGVTHAAATSDFLDAMDSLNTEGKNVVMALLKALTTHYETGGDGIPARILRILAPVARKMAERISS